MRTLPIHMMSDMFHSMTELHHVDACIPLKARPSAASTPACAQLMARLCVVFANNPFDRDRPLTPWRANTWTWVNLGERGKGNTSETRSHKAPFGWSMRVVILVRPACIKSRPYLELSRATTKAFTR